MTARFVHPSVRVAAACVGAVSLGLSACARRPGADAPAPAVSGLRFAAGDSVVVDTVAAGLVHYAVARPAGPYEVHIVTVPVGSRYELVAARALDSLYGRERVSNMVRRRRERGERVPVALNADFFDLGTGANENNQVIDGEIWKAVTVTDSPHDTFRNAHTQFAVGVDGRPYLDRLTYAGSLVGSCGRFVLDGVNVVPRVPNALVLFTSAYGAAPRGDSARTPRELLVAAPPIPAGRGITDAELTVTTVVSFPQSTIPAGRAVLAGYGTAAARRDSIARCSGTFRVEHGFRPDRGRLTTVVGGWPRVVRGGRNVAGAADSVEGTFPRFSAQRHPRSAVGFSRDSSTVFLVAVDGRRETSVGMSLVELGDFLVSIGIHDALNLDGGGSTALVIDGRVVNRPSDPSGERTVGNALLVRERR